MYSPSSTNSARLLRNRIARFMTDMVADEGSGHPEPNIILKMRVAGHEYLRDQRLETRLVNQNVNVHGP